MEANLLLATIAQRYRLHLIDGVEIKPAALITMFPRDGLPMRLERRSPSQAAHSKNVEIDSAVPVA